MKSYHSIVENVLNNGVEKQDRTGTGTRAIAGAMFEHDMANGFPLLTTKKIPYRLISSELEFFIKGITDKNWLREEHNNHIWDEWCSPLKVPYSHNADVQQKMLEERDLGPIYGFQWRHFNAPYTTWDADYGTQGVDQLKIVVETLKTNPNDRRMIVMAWNPAQLSEMALPPCHYGFQVTVLDGKLNLLWNQRSVDTMLGLPFNIASYATLLHLLAKETGLKEGKLVGFLADVHIYRDHIDGAREQLERDPEKYPLPTIETPEFTSIFDWKYTDTQIIGYESYPRIQFPIAV